MFCHTSRVIKNACKLSAIVGLSVVLVFIFITKVWFRPFEMYVIRWNLTEDISCHQRFTDDALPLVDNTFFPPEKSIFFLETSCRGGLNSRQACAVESAAKNHPSWDVHVLFTGPVTEFILENSCLSQLRSYKNLKLLRIHIEDYSKGTVLENVVFTNQYNKSKWRIEHSSDFLRYLTLYKYGGVYLDTDVVVVKPLDSLGSNWAGRESDWAVDAGAMSFSRDAVGRKIATAAIKDIKKNYRPNVWGYNGPGVITRLIKNMCKGKKWNQGCNGFKIYEPAVFYPVYYKQNSLYFQKGAKLTNEKKAYVHHLWNAFTKKYAVQKGSPYDRLAKEYCPIVYNLYGELFGV